MSSEYSVSKIHDFFKCPTYYALRYNQGIVPSVPKSADLEFGTAMHLGLEHMIKSNNGLEMFNLYWSSLKNTPMEHGRLKYEQLQSCGEILLTRFQRLHLKHFKETVCQEERLEADFDGIKISGTPDWSGYLEDAGTVVDFKTSGFRYDKGRIIVGDQLPFYTSLLMLKKQFIPTQKTYYVFIKDAKAPSIQTLSAPLIADEVQKSVDNLVCQAKIIDKTRVYVKNTEQCIIGQRKCAYFETCWGKTK